MPVLLHSLVLAGMLLALAGQAAVEQARLDQLVNQAAAFESGTTRESLRELERLVQTALADRSTQAQMEDALIHLAGASSTYEAKRFACQQLGIIGTAKALPRLRELLAIEETAGIACLALGAYPPGPADEVLRDAWPAATGRARLQIINAWGDRRDPRALRLLSRAAREDDAAVAEAATASIGKLGDVRAWKELTAMAKHPRPEMAAVLLEARLRCAGQLVLNGERKRAATAYESLQSPDLPLAARRAAFAGWLAADPDKASQRILNILAGRDETLKPVAIANLPARPDFAVLRQLAERLPQLAPPLQVMLLEKLGSGETPEAFTIIQGGLSLPAAEPRLAAIAALARTSGERAIPPLVRALDAEPNAVEATAIETALTQLPAGSAIDAALAEHLQTAHQNARARLITVLAQRQREAANPLLVAQLNSGNTDAVKAALRALAKSGGATEAPALLAFLAGAASPDLQREAEGAAGAVLERGESKEARAELILRQLNSAAPDAMRRLLPLLSISGAPKALARAEQALRDPDPETREVALRTLVDWPNATAWDVLARVCSQPDSESQRQIAFRALGRLAGESAASQAGLVHQTELLALARNANDRKLALAALSGATDPAALKLAVPLLADEAVRAEAAIAVKKIAEAVQAKDPQAAQSALRALEPQK